MRATRFTVEEVGLKLMAGDTEQAKHVAEYLARKAIRTMHR